MPKDQGWLRTRLGLPAHLHRDEESRNKSLLSLQAAAYCNASHNSDNNTHHQGSNTSRKVHTPSLSLRLSLPPLFLSSCPILIIDFCLKKQYLENNTQRICILSMSSIFLTFASLPDSCILYQTILSSSGIYWTVFGIMPSVSTEAGEEKHS